MARRWVAPPGGSLPPPAVIKRKVLQARRMVGTAMTILMRSCPVAMMRMLMVSKAGREGGIECREEPETGQGEQK